jgi:peptide/nickel transport system ATP-binding protein
MSTPGLAAGTAEPLLAIDDLCVQFRTRAGIVTAVDGVSLRIRPGEILGLVGESGAGKSVTGLSILGLLDRAGRVAGGRILFEGSDLLRLGEAELRQLRGERIAIIFQDPMSTLNPVLRIDTQMTEAIRAHHPAVSRQEARSRAVEALAQVGIAAPAEMLAAYPHQYSGGMRQRVAIAIALINGPRLLIADEPTTALDATTQAQVLYEIQKLCLGRGTAILWITHDLAVVAALADTIAVMYAGRIVEQGPVDAVLDHPRHPYTRGLISSVPSENARGVPVRQISGMAPSPLAIPRGCGFRDRCDRADARCRDVPPLATTAPGHWVRCFHPYGDAS